MIALNGTARSELAHAAVAVLRTHDRWSAKRAVAFCCGKNAQWAEYFENLKGDGQKGFCNLVKRIEARGE